MSWDCPHLLNLVIMDVKTGKSGTASGFITRFIERNSIFTHELNYGKGNAILEAVAGKSDGSTVTPTAYSHTR